MKCFVIFLILFEFTSLVLSYDNDAYGLWIPKSPSDLLESSDVIFVGNITSVNVLQFEKQSSILVNEDGIDKNIVENYTLNLDEYTVNVEEFLKNPQSSNKITVRQPTIGLPTGIGPLGGFETGDRVLFYVENLDGTNEYSPESFIIPKPCMGKDVLTQQRLEFGGESFTIQNGIKVDYGNFTADKPVLFVYNKDVRTLSGQSFDVIVEISKNEGKHAKAVFSKEIHAASKPCEWIAYAEWEFTPKEGDYNMDINIKENGTVTDQSHTGFYVKSYAVIQKSMSPLQQFKAGISLTEIKCKESLTLLKKTGNELPICVSTKTGQKLLERKFAQTIAATGPLESLQKSDSYQREVTILSISPKNVTLPDHSEATWTKIQIKESIDKSKPLEITNLADGNKTHLAKLTIGEVIIHTKYGNNSTGYNTLIFKYSIESVDKDAFYAMPDFEAHFGNRAYPSQMIGDEFSTLLLPGEKRDSSFAVQIGKGANQILLVIKDPATKQTLWSFPVTWHTPSLKNEGNGVLTQE